MVMEAVAMQYVIESTSSDAAAGAGSGCCYWGPMPCLTVHVGSVKHS